MLIADIEDQEIDVNMSSNGRLLDDELLDFIAVYFPNEFMAHGIYAMLFIYSNKDSDDDSDDDTDDNTDTYFITPLLQ
jgi:hypothetical protein